MTTQTHNDDHREIQTQPGKSRPADPGLSRRALLAGAGAALAGAAAVGATIPASAHAVDDALARIIETHRVAHAVYLAAIDAEEDAQRVFTAMTKGQELFCATSIGPNGETMSGYCDMARVSEAEIIDRITDTHNSLRATHLSKWSRMMVPAFADQMMEAITAAQERAIANIPVVRVRYDQKRDASGLEAAAKATRTTMEQEQTALAKLLAHRPRSAAEREVKLAYLGEFEAYAGDAVDDDGTMVILYGLLNEVAS